MTRKKIVFVIVEGPSDDDALGVVFSKFYSKDEVHVEVMHCDITTDIGRTPIVSKIGNVVKSYAGHAFKQSDFRQIIHIVDMDGAYIPDENIVEDPDATKPYYSTADIRTCNKVGIENRNRQKRDNLNRLTSISQVWKIPYSVFYMSSNLDHALYGKLNSTDDEKEHDAFYFSMKYKNNLPSFIQFISESEFSVCNDYKESWRFIKEALHSLERHTNLGLCFTTTEPHSDNFSAPNA